MSDIVPFLKAVGGGTSSKPLGSALPRIATSTPTSPWSPKPTVAEAPAAPVVDVAAITAQAIEEGRAEGLRETEALRARLVMLIAELDKARAAYVAPATELIADAATAVVEGWVEGTDHKTLFAPLVEAWISNGSKSATACCHPDDADALRSAIGETNLAIEVDPTIRRGDLVIADATRELAHTWEPRLRELREAIAGALAES